MVELLYIVNRVIMVELFQEKVNAAQGTWIDWQYLFDAAKLLAKCRYLFKKAKKNLLFVILFSTFYSHKWNFPRYTLQYTYPYAYYIEPCPRKELVCLAENFKFVWERILSLLNCGRGTANSTFHEYFSVWVPASATGGGDRKFELEGEYSCLHLSILLCWCHTLWIFCLHLSIG